MVCPIILGAGTTVLPDEVRTCLLLRREHWLRNGMVQLTYDVRQPVRGQGTTGRPG